MPKAKEKESRFFKGYDIKWLREEPSHPDFHLVAEYDALMASKEEPVEEPKEEAKSK